jgi:hypothetical protein
MPNPSPSLVAPYDQWVKGYASTKSVSVAVGKVVQDAATGHIYAAFPVVLFATQSDDSLQLFTGCYTTHRANVGISENPNDKLWSIYATDLSLIPDACQGRFCQSHLPELSNSAQTCRDVLTPRREPGASEAR